MNMNYGVRRTWGDIELHRVSLEGILMARCIEVSTQQSTIFLEVDGQNQQREGVWK
jgi:hypothetical protein